MFPDLPPAAVHVQNWAIWLTAIGTCLVAVWRYFVLPRLVTPMRKAWLRVSAGLETVERVGAELGANGGKSLKDRIERIDSRTRRTDARQLALFSTDPAAHFETDREGKFTGINHAFEEMTGYGPMEMRGWNGVNALHPEDRHRVMTEWTHAVKQQRTFRERCRYQTCDGRVLPVIIEAHPMIDSVDGSVVGWLGTVEAVS